MFSVQSSLKMAVETRQSRNGSTTQKGKEGDGGTHSGMQNGQEDEKKMNKTFYIIFLSLIIDLLAFTVILPLLPSLLDHYGHNDKVSECYLVLERKARFGIEI